MEVEVQPWITLLLQALQLLIHISGNSLWILDISTSQTSTILSQVIWRSWKNKTTYPVSPLDTLQEPNTDWRKHWKAWFWADVIFRSSSHIPSTSALGAVSPETPQSDSNPSPQISQGRQLCLWVKVSSLLLTQQFPNCDYHSVCQAFESTFGLVYNETYNLYLVNNSIHEKLLALNPSVTLFLGNTPSGGQVINITLPYAAFDVMAAYPLVDNTALFFHLQRTMNDIQYTLGSTFLQEACIIVDYERSNFSIRQCYWDEDAIQYIIAILPVNITSTGSSGPATTTNASSNPNDGLSSGAKACIAVGPSCFSCSHSESVSSLSSYLVTGSGRETLCRNHM